MKGKKSFHVVSVVTLATLMLAMFVSAAVASPPTKLAIVPPDATYEGFTYSEWSAKWWQWALSLPVERNPFFDETGCANGDQGQAGPVWFLTGVFNESGIAVRECTIPAGKALFFPILNSECSDIEDPPWHGGDETEMSECAKMWMDMAKNLKCKIDGRAVGSLHKYRVQSPMFTFNLPENNVWGMPPTTGAQSVSDGVFLMVEPLAAGQHTIEFTGSLPGFALHITYYLNVMAEP